MLAQLLHHARILRGVGGEALPVEEAAADLAALDGHFGDVALLHPVHELGKAHLLSGGLGLGEALEDHHQNQPDYQPQGDIFRNVIHSHSSSDRETADIAAPANQPFRITLESGNFGCNAADAEGARKTGGFGTRSLIPKTVRHPSSFPGIPEPPGTARRCLHGRRPACGPSLFRTRPAGPPGALRSPVPGRP